MRRNNQSVQLIRAELLTVGRGVTMASHSHSRDQLTLAVEGSLQIETSQGMWTVPAGGAVWISHGVEHAERLHAGALLWTLHIEPGMPGGSERPVRTLLASPLLRELVARTGELDGLDDSVPEQARLAGVLVDEIHAREEAPFRLPTPRDPRALRFARLVDETPADRVSVAELARRVGTSRRTMERLFMTELGVSVGGWRQRLRLHHALRLLAAQHRVADVARDSGYGSASAFIAAFKRHFGVTPHRWGLR
jgi:AraC-like DNA-binding protein